MYYTMNDTIVEYIVSYIVSSRVDIDMHCGVLRTARLHTQSSETRATNLLHEIHMK